MMNVLFLNVGRRCELVELTQHALRARGGGKVIGTDLDRLAPGLQVVDRAQVFRAREGPALLQELTDLCREESIALVIPSIDPDLERLLALEAALGQALPHTRILLPGRFAVEKSRDKRLTKDVFVAAGAKVARLEVAEFPPLPVFVRPAHGSSGIGAEKIDSQEDLERARIDLGADLMVERFIEGSEITVDVFCAMAAKPLLALARRRIKVRAGEVVQGVLERDPQAEALAMGVARELRATAPITVQFIRTTDRQYFGTEVNARLGGGLPLSVAAGADWMGWLIDDTAGVAFSADVPIRDGMHMTRADRSFFLRP